MNTPAIAIPPTVESALFAAQSEIFAHIPEQFHQAVAQKLPGFQELCACPQQLVKVAKDIAMLAGLLKKKFPTIINKLWGWDKSDVREFLNLAAVFENLDESRLGSITPKTMQRLGTKKSRAVLEKLYQQPGIIDQKVVKEAFRQERLEKEKQRIAKKKALAIAVQPPLVEGVDMETGEIVYTLKETNLSPESGRWIKEKLGQFKSVGQIIAHAANLEAENQELRQQLRRIEGEGMKQPQAAKRQAIASDMPIDTVPLAAGEISAPLVAHKQQILNCQPWEEIPQMKIQNLNALQQKEEVIPVLSPSAGKLLELSEKEAWQGWLSVANFVKRDGKKLAGLLKEIEDVQSPVFDSYRKILDGLVSYLVNEHCQEALSELEWLPQRLLDAAKANTIFTVNGMSDCTLVRIKGLGTRKEEWEFKIPSLEQHVTVGRSAIQVIEPHSSLASVCMPREHSQLPTRSQVLTGKSAIGSGRRSN